MINPRVYTRHVVSSSIKRNQRVSIVTSQKDPNSAKNVRKSPYLNFTKQINNTFEKLLAVADISDEAQDVDSVFNYLKNI